jgi:uncharacterized protein (DUF885 family)
MQRLSITTLLAIVAITLTAPALAQTKPQSPDDLRAIAKSYYAWRDTTYPVGTSDAGNHEFDNRIDDFRMKSVLAARHHVKALLDQVKAMKTGSWAKDDRVDWVLFVSELQRADFFDRVLQPEETDPGTYINECSTAIFTLLKKEYGPKRTRALAATARLEQLPAMLIEARRNLTRPVRLYATLAIESARGGDELYTDSMMSLDEGLSPAEHDKLVAARDRAVKSIHEFADWLDKGQAKMPAWRPMGEKEYNYLLKKILLLPYDAKQVEMIGEVELARYRALESMLKDPSFASPDPARAAHIPANEAEFLANYEARLAEIVKFLNDNRLVTIPSYIGTFKIRQLPEAFKPASPGGWMTPPGIYDADDNGFFFIPTYDPKSQNFYIRAGIEDPRPILGHEGIPGHFLQISIANHVKDEIRRQHYDNTFAEGWALYGEEMLMREGLYPDQSPSQGQVLRLSRYRAARILVDVNLQTGRWTFEQAVQHFMEAGGLDKEAATGEAAGAAVSPSQKLGYMVGKWQIMRLLGMYREREGKNFRLGAFHDQLISYGSLPLSVVEWLMFDDASGVEAALK